MQPKKPTSNTRSRPAPPAILFLGLVMAVMVMGIWVSRTAPRIVSGLPLKAEVVQAAELLNGRLRADTGGLRLETALLGENQAGETFSAAHVERAERADSLLAAADARDPNDPRIAAARAGLALVCRDYGLAIRSYRQAVEREPGYGEARLGLGVALALRAGASAAPRDRHGLWLRALAQFANVGKTDPAFEAALYNRVVLLGRVGRVSEARRHAAAYRAIDDTSVWAEALARELDSL